MIKKSRSLPVVALASAFVLSACSHQHDDFMSEPEQREAISNALAEKQTSSLDKEGIVFWDSQKQYGVIFTRAVQAADFEAAKYKRIRDDGTTSYILPSAPVVYGDQLSLPKPAYVYENSSYKPQYTVQPDTDKLCHYQTDDCVNLSSVTDPILNSHIRKIVAVAKPA